MTCAICPNYGEGGCPHFQLRNRVRKPNGGDYGEYGAATSCNRSIDFEFKGKGLSELARR